MSSLRNDSDLVYSTESGRMCPLCRKPVDKCNCLENRKKRIAPGDGVVRVGRETKGRKGKGVTVISGVSLPADELTQLAKTLKQRCGCGGTVKEGVVEIQGDKRELLVEVLKKMGFTVKRSGG